jgi:hypothetical protein
LTATFANAGFSAASGVVTVTAYASADDVVDPSDLMVGFVARKGRWLPFSFRRFTIKVRFPAPSADGDVNVIAVGTFGGADAGSKRAGTLSLRRPVTDLVGGPVTDAPTIAPGRAASIAISLVNEGNVPARGRVTVDLLASPDGSTNAAGAIPLATLPGRVSLGAGGAGVLKLRFDVPATLPAPVGPGGYTLLVRLATSFLGAANVTDGGLLAVLPFTPG